MGPPGSGDRDPRPRNVGWQQAAPRPRWTGYRPEQGMAEGQPDIAEQMRMFPGSYVGIGNYQPRGEEYGLDQYSPEAQAFMRRRRYGGQ